MKFTALLASTALATLIALPGSATELRMLSSWPSNQSYTANVVTPLVEKIEELSGGGITIDVAGPEVVPAFEQLEPVQAGVFDLLFTHPAYHIGAASIGLAIEGMKADPALRRASGVIDTLDEYYNDLGLKVIAVAPAGSVAFNFILKDPIGDAPSLEGRKIRGTQTYNPVIEGVGGAPVILPMTDIYSSLQTGVIDGAGTTLTGIAEKKWYEVSNYLSRPKFGTVGLFVFMNLDSWESLSPEEQEIISKAAIEIENSSVEQFDGLAAKEEAFLIEQGMELTEMPAEDAERLETLFSDGAWATARSTGGALAEKMHEQAEKAGLLQ
ncbi:TRAP transporter substrate-binding protein DctP [Poseidonocella sp. HB161398]|uniref:TRAP transporter substrate-binding protein DctP n=1 Tax=Poseidonocella sp. HB161398 TaxID=2320855 RepID=UPI0014873A7C|nr:TRAP transporter substrate-binding protein DctP [Poseidonocella sp. HB161398]